MVPPVFKDTMWLMWIIQTTLQPPEFVADPGEETQGMSCYEELLIGGICYVRARVRCLLFAAGCLLLLLLLLGSAEDATTCGFPPSLRTAP